MAISIDKILVTLFVVAMYFYTITTTLSKLLIVICSIYAFTHLFYSSKERINKTVLLGVVFFFLLNLFVGCFGTFRAAMSGVDSDYIFLDSAGFPIMFLCIPVVIYLVDKPFLIEFFVKRFIHIGALVSVLSLILFIAYPFFFGTLTLKSITAANIAISSLGLDFKLQASSGMLRVNTNSVQLIFMCVFITAWANCMSKNKKLFLFFLFFLGVAADGHRVVVVLTALMIFAYFYLVNVRAMRNFIFLLLVLSGVFIFSDLIYSRFDFTTESSSLRLAQINALLDKMAEHPIIGNGLGSSASIIRNDERPFLYEVDTLAVMMKIGIPLSVLYFANWFTPMFFFIKSDYKFSLSHVKALFVFLFIFSSLVYMTSNGGFSMSPLSAIFQVCMIICFIWIRLNVVNDATQMRRINLTH